MNNKGIYFVFLTAAISGLSIFINKFGVDVVNSSVFALLKNSTVALLVIGSLILLKDWRILKTIQKKQWFYLVMIGLIGGAVPFLLFFKGLSLTSGAQAAFIHKTLFIWAAVGALLFLKEKISKNFVIAGFLIIVGNLLMLKMLPTKFGMGDILILAATLLWAVETVISKKILEKISVQAVIGARMFFGSMFILLYIIAIGQLSLVASINLSQIGWVMITSVLLLGYNVFWYQGLKLLKVSVAAAVLAIGGPITALLNLGLAHQPISLGQSLGIMCIVIAVGCVLIFNRFNYNLYGKSS